MSENAYSIDVVDSITRFAIHQASRRKFIGWVGKVGLAVAASVGGGLALVLPAFAALPCGQLFPGCTGPCDCESTCTDPDFGVQGCVGNCSPCGPASLVEVTSFWFWDPADGKCHHAKDCAPCS